MFMKMSTQVGLCVGPNLGMILLNETSVVQPSAETVFSWIHVANMQQLVMSNDKASVTPGCGAWILPVCWAGLPD